MGYDTYGYLGQPKDYTSKIMYYLVEMWEIHKVFPC